MWFLPSDVSVGEHVEPSQRSLLIASLQRRNRDISRAPHTNGQAFPVAEFNSPKGVAGQDLNDLTFILFRFPLGSSTSKQGLVVIPLIPSFHL